MSHNPLRDYSPDRFDLYGDKKRHSEVTPWLIALSMIGCVGLILAGIFPFFFALVLIGLAFIAEAF